MFTSKQYFSLNVFILHQLRNNFIQVHTNLSRFCFLGTTPVFGPNVWANENPKVDTHSCESKLGPYCGADAAPHDYGHHQARIT